jgi:hypothetical protein
MVAGKFVEAARSLPGHLLDHLGHHRDVTSAHHAIQFEQRIHTNHAGIPICSIDFFASSSVTLTYWTGWPVAPLCIVDRRQRCRQAGRLDCAGYGTDASSRFFPFFESPRMNPCKN